MNHALSCLLLVLALAAGCTRENAAFCCIDAADCAAQGIDENRQCTAGLSCVDNQCVASMCATSGCAAAAPVCEVTTDTCVGCSSATECMRFPATDVCDVTSGACVECMSAMDCDAARPVCDGMGCRTCKLDSECPSGACAEDGACVPESGVVYLKPQGTDVAPCSRAQPCQRLPFALTQTSNARAHIVFASGEYVVPPQPIRVDSTTTSAGMLSIHGGGAKIYGPTSSDGLLDLRMPTVLRDLEIENPAGRPLGAFSTIILERIKIRGEYGLAVGGSVTMRGIDVRVQRAGIAISNGSISLDGAIVNGGTVGIYANGSPVIDIKNVLITGTSDVGLDVTNASGMVSFTTIVDTGFSVAGATGLKCSMLASGVSISTSIVWTHETGRPAAEGACLVTNSIIGPIAFGGAMTINPGFVDVNQANFHLAPTSPARDAADSGPASDFEGDSRPRGVRFDLGADEAP